MGVARGAELRSRHFIDNFLGTASSLVVIRTMEMRFVEQRILVWEGASVLLSNSVKVTFLIGNKIATV